MKASSATSARATTAGPRHTGRSSDRRTPTPTSVDGFALPGPSDPPDPAFNAYRKDLADVALAGRVIASHYAEPVARTIIAETVLRTLPAEDSEAVREMLPGEPFLMLDDSLGWAWGYSAADLRVGYVPSEAVGG